MYKVVGSGKDRSLRVLWTLEELGQDYELIKAMPGSKEAKDINPTGKVPALVFDGAAYTDSVAIMSFLADRHGALTFPAGSTERLELDGHLHFLIEEMDCLLWTAAKHKFINPEEFRCAEIKPYLDWEFKRSLQRLEDRLGDGRFLMGNDFTIADILAVHCLNWAFVAKFSKPSDRILAYAKAMRARPAYKAALSAA